MYIDHSAQFMSLAASSISDLDLAPHAKAGAESLVKDFGSTIVFTSGRRSVDDQCRVMAENVVTQGRDWIAKTYKAGKELQDWVDANPQAKTVEEIKEGLFSIMNTWSEAKLKAISYHLVGAAFDLLPVSDPNGTKIKTAIQQLANKRTFLDGESGVKVWHVDFNE